MHVGKGCSQHIEVASADSHYQTYGHTMLHRGTASLVFQVATASAAASDSDTNQVNVKKATKTSQVCSYMQTYTSTS
ncbi:hypothetical protein ABVT39_023033 [Epinephelus coioides]